jgi:hypothetical protein
MRVDVRDQRYRGQIGIRFRPAQSGTRGAGRETVGFFFLGEGAALGSIPILRRVIAAID